MGGAGAMEAATPEPPVSSLIVKGGIAMSARLLVWLMVLVGVILAIAPWLLRFTADRTALVDVATGGIIVALLGLALMYVARRRISANHGVQY